MNLQGRKNGNTFAISQEPNNTSGTGQSLFFTKIVYFNGSTDYADFTVYQSTGVNRTLQQGSNGSGTWFSATLITNGGISITNYQDNRVLTSNGTLNGVNSESNLLFDGSCLQVVGWATISGTLSVGGKVSSHLIPSQDGVYDLGASASGNQYRWRDLYLTGNTIYLGSARIGSSGSTVNLENVNVSNNLQLSGNISYATSSSNLGEVIKIGNTSTTAGSLYYYGSSGWALSNSNSPSTSTGLLGIAIGTNSGVAGMLVRGYATLNYSVGTNGGKLYVSETTGQLTSTQPSTSTYVVRIVGYVLNSGTNYVYFCPDTNWIELV